MTFVMLFRGTLNLFINRSQVCFSFTCGLLNILGGYTLAATKTKYSYIEVTKSFSLVRLLKDEGNSHKARGRGRRSSWLDGSTKTVKFNTGGCYLVPVSNQ